MIIQTQVRRPKVLEIEVARALAIAAVVLIHATADATARIGESPLALAEGSALQYLFLAVNKLSHFAVPVFILLSGLVLFYRYYDDWNRGQVIQFYKRRVVAVIVPYLIWSMFYYVFTPWLYFRTFEIHWDRLGEHLLWGETSYHLYFMVIIVQFYVLFPAILSLVKRFRMLENLMIPIGLAVQTGFYAYGRYVEPLEHKPTLAVTYFTVFMIGGYIGIRYADFQLWLRRHIAWILPAALLTGAAFAGMYFMERYGARAVANPWYELGMNLYAALIALVFIWLGRTVTPRLPQLHGWLLALGSASFGVYLLHPALLSLYRFSTGPTQSLLAYCVFMLLSFLVPLLGAWFIAYLYGSAGRSYRQRQSRRLPRSVDPAGGVKQAG